MPVHIRVDDRLVHGQVVTAWIRHLKCKAILVADDAAASSAITQKALKIATPQGIQLHVKSIADAAQHLRETDPDATMVIVRSPKEALRLIEAAADGPSWEVNVGNVGKAPGREKVTNSVYLDAADQAAVRALAERGVRIFAQTVPSGPVQPLG